VVHTGKRNQISHKMTNCCCWRVIFWGLNRS